MFIVQGFLKEVRPNKSQEGRVSYICTIEEIGDSPVTVFVNSNPTANPGQYVGGPARVKARLNNGAPTLSVSADMLGPVPVPGYVREKLALMSQAVK